MSERARIDQAVRVLCGYLMAWTIGPLFGVPFWLLALAGVIRTRGYWRAVREIWHGRVIIAANHPSLLETFLIPIAFWPIGMIFPSFFIWSMPDKRLLPVPDWTHELMRCVRVDRGEGDVARAMNMRALKRMIQLLHRGYSFGIHPEGGRSAKQEKKTSAHGREMGVVKNDSIPKVASLTDARILPVWVDMPPQMREGLPGFGESIRRIFKSSCTPITLHYGFAYHVKRGADLPHEMRRLEQEILAA